MQDKLAPLAWSKVGRWCLFVWRRGEGAGMGQTDGQTGNDESGCERSAESRHRGLILGPDGRYYSRGGARASGSEHPQPPQASTIRLFNPVVETTDGTGSHMSSWQREKILSWEMTRSNVNCRIIILVKQGDRRTRGMALDGGRETS